MNRILDAGALRERLEILECRESRPGIWTWETARKTWGQVQVRIQAKRELFSAMGIGARGANLVLRRQALTLHHALRWQGQHLFLTAILPQDRGYLEVSAALVEVEDCIGHPVPPGEPVQFSGVLTEQYQGYAQGEPYAYNEIRLVLVTPKPVALIPGGLVQAKGSLWHILSAHTLDPWKNEYIIARVLEH